MIHLVPDEIKLNKKLNLRKYDLSDQKERDRKILELARSILVNTQEQPVLVRVEKSGFSLITGSRRRLAGIAINEGKLKDLYDPKKEGPFMLEAKIVEKSDLEAKQAALAENIHRENFTPMELCYLIGDVRKENGWEGGDKGDGNTQKVADYFGVSRATITQTEKLGTLPKAIRELVHARQLSPDAALLHVKVDDDKKEVVMSDAKKLAKKEAEEKAAAREAKGKKDGGRLSKKQKAERKKSEESPRVQKKHVAEAARKHKAIDDQTKNPRSKKEILDVFEGLKGPASPPKMAAFAVYLTDTFAKGKGTEGKLIALWDAIGEALPKSEQGKTTVDDKKKAA